MTARDWLLALRGFVTLTDALQFLALVFLLGVLAVVLMAFAPSGVVR